MKTVLITGAAKGIGAAIVEEFAKEGYQVILHYNTSEQKARILKEKLTNNGQNVEIYKADLTKKTEVEKMVETIICKYGKIDVLVNNAGISQIKPFAEIEEENWDNMIDTNLKSVYLTTKAVINNMIMNQKGSIINISSIWGVTGGSCEVHYSAAKAGIIGFTKALAKEMALSNIKVNAIAPGIIETDMNNDLTKEDLVELKKEIPLQRVGTPKEIAKAVKWLAESEYITGQVIRIDGGWLM